MAVAEDSDVLLETEAQREARHAEVRWGGQAGFGVAILIEAVGAGATCHACQFACSLQGTSAANLLSHVISHYRTAAGCHLAVFCSRCPCFPCARWCAGAQDA